MLNNKIYANIKSREHKDISTHSLATSNTYLQFD